MKNSKGRGIRRKLAGISIMLVLVSILLFISMSSDSTAQYNYDHVNVTTIVNVTNAAPEILNISLNGNQNIVLAAGGNRNVVCNATIRDWNGFNDLDVVNATLYYYLNTSNQADDLNEHYTNTSCTEASTDGQYLANYTCSFQVAYFANNGTWNCNMTVNDSKNYIDSATNSSVFDALYALNVTDVIDYGNLSVTDYSANVTATVTNFGNRNINVSVLGYGQTQGDGLGFVCTQGTNITVNNEKFSLSLVDWGSKTPLSTTNQDMNTTILQQTNDILPETKDTFWQLYVPPNPFGVCTGTVRFTATTP